MSIQDVMQNTPKLKLTDIVFADWHKWTYPECEAFVDAVEGLILDVISKTNVPDESEISDPKIGDTVWISGIIERSIGHEFLVRFPDGNPTWIDKKRVIK